MATSITSRPILFAAPMVRAILDGRKTQTRRAIAAESDPLECPWGTVGDQLWVREKWGYVKQFDNRRAGKGGPILYAADFLAPRPGPWRASCHMPRTACRVTLEITHLRTERLRDISAADARVEGFPDDQLFADPLAWFQHTWDSLHASRGAGWRENPLVWVIGFKAHVPAAK